MKLSEYRKDKLLNGLDILNTTVGGKLQDILKAEKDVKEYLPKIGIYLEYSDYTNRWYFADIKGNEIEL